MTYDSNANIDLIEKYIDGSANDEEKTIVEQLLNNNADLKDEYECMKMAVESVKLSALHKQVGNIAAAYNTGKNNNMVAHSETAKVRNIGFYAMRAAAVLVVVFASYTAIQYVTITPDKLYTSAFEDYSLSATRSASKGTGAEQSFKIGDWAGVLSAISNESGQKEKFLGGVSALHLNKANIAAGYFNEVIESNKTLTQKSYTEESEFYLALAYIKLQNYNAAKSLLHKITANPKHVYHNQAKRINTLSITLLSFKK